MTPQRLCHHTSRSPSVSETGTLARNMQTPVQECACLLRQFRFLLHVKYVQSYDAMEACHSRNLRCNAQLCLWRDIWDRMSTFTRTVQFHHGPNRYTFASPFDRVRISDATSATGLSGTFRISRRACGPRPQPLKTLRRCPRGRQQRDGGRGRWPLLARSGHMDDATTIGSRAPLKLFA